MSRIGELGPNLKNLPAVLASYEDDIANAAKIMPIKGKTLEEAFKEQCQWPCYYGIKKAELKSLVDHMETQVARVRGERTRAYVEHHSRELGERMISIYVNNEPDYLKMNALMLEVREVYDAFSQIMDAFDRRGFALRDLTSLRVNELHREILD